MFGKSSLFRCHIQHPPGEQTCTHMHAPVHLHTLVIRRVPLLKHVPLGPMSSSAPSVFETFARIWRAGAISLKSLCVTYLDCNKQQDLKSWSLSICLRCSLGWGLLAASAETVLSRAPRAGSAAAPRLHLPPISGSWNYCGRFSLRLVPWGAQNLGYHSEARPDKGQRGFSLR